MERVSAVGVSVLVMLAGCNKAAPVENRDRERTSDLKPEPRTRPRTPPRPNPRPRPGGKNVIHLASDAGIAKAPHPPCGFPFGLKPGMSKKAFVSHMRARGAWPAGSKIDRFTPPKVAATQLDYAEAKFDPGAGLLEVTLTRWKIKKRTGADWYYKRLTREISLTMPGVLPKDAEWPAGRFLGMGWSVAKRWWLCRGERSEVMLWIERYSGPRSQDDPTPWKVKMTYRWTPVSWKLKGNKRRWAWAVELGKQLRLKPKELGRIVRNQKWHWTRCPVELGAGGTLKINCTGDVVTDIYVGRWVYSGGGLYLTLTQANTFDWPAGGCRKLWYGQPRRCTVGPDPDKLCLRRLDKCGWRSKHHLWTDLPKKYLARPKPKRPAMK